MKIVIQLRSGKQDRTNYGIKNLRGHRRKRKANARKIAYAARDQIIHDTLMAERAVIIARDIANG